MTVGSKPENGEPNNAAKSDHIGQNAHRLYHVAYHQANNLSVASWIWPRRAR